MTTYFVLYLLLHLSTEWISIFDIFMFQTLRLDCNIADHDQSSEMRLWGGFSQALGGVEEPNSRQAIPGHPLRC